MLLWGSTSESIVSYLFCFSNTELNRLFRPDIPGQSNLDPGYAAQLWMANIQPLKAQGYTLITPVVAYKKSWLQSFFAACPGCTVRIVS